MARPFSVAWPTGRWPQLLSVSDAAPRCTKSRAVANAAGTASRQIPPHGHHPLGSTFVWFSDDRWLFACDRYGRHSSKVVVLEVGVFGDDTFRDLTPVWIGGHSAFMLDRAHAFLIQDANEFSHSGPGPIRR